MNVDQPLLRPVELGDLRLPNRVVVAPTTRARATGADLAPGELHAAYYGQRATAGLIITEGVWVSERAVGFVNVPGLFSAAQVAGWARVADLVHALGGRIVAQLWHTGAASHPDHLGGALPAGPSAVNPREVSFTARGPRDTVTPRELTVADIRQVVADYAAASANARRAGFDGVELHALGSFLLPQFLNPALNRRADGYGGDRAGRRRLLLEVVDAVAGQWDGRRVGVRLSPWWTAPRFPGDAAALADHDELVAALAEHPVGYLHLRGPEPAGGPDLAGFDRYRRLFGGPLVVNHGFDRESGNAAVAAGVADAVSFGTAFIANPDLVSRFALDRPLNPGDPATYYTGGVAGYLDYPLADWAAVPA